MVSDNLPLVWVIANPWLRRHPAMNRKYREEVVQEATFGLIRAVRYFKPDMGVKFSTYACRAIYRQIQRWCKWLFAERRTPKTSVFSIDTGWDERGGWLAQQIRDFDREEMDERESHYDTGKEAVRAMDALDPRTAAIIQDRSEGRTLQEIGDIMGVTKERIRQIEGRGLRRLKSIVDDSL